MAKVKGAKHVGTWTLPAPNPTSTEHSCFSVLYVGIPDDVSFGKKGKVRFKKVGDRKAGR